MTWKKGEANSKSNIHFKSKSRISKTPPSCNYPHRISVVEDLERLGLKRCVLRSAASERALPCEGSTESFLNFSVDVFGFNQHEFAEPS